MYVLYLGSRDGVVVIALSYHLRGPGSDHEWVKLDVGSLLCSKRFFSGFSSFRLSSKINISKFQVDRRHDFHENHFRVSGPSWVNISNYQQKARFHLNVPILAMRLSMK